MQHFTTILAAAALGGGLLMAFGAGDAAQAADKEAAFTLTPDEYGMVLKTPDGRTVFRYMTKKPADTKLTANSVCCLYPVKTPAGEDVVDFAPSDHPHHRGVFLAWHATEGKKPADFWGWGEWAPTKDRVIENRSVKLVSANAKFAELEVRNDWMVEGEVAVEELLKIEAGIMDGAYAIELQFQLTPAADLSLRQTAFGGFCVKARKDGKSAYSDPKGVVDLPNPHHLKPETDWPAAPWYDFTTELAGGKKIGIAVVNDSKNPPSVWHNLAPIAMINPCIVAKGPVTLKAGKPFRLRYGLVVHDGPPPVELLNKLAKKWNP